MSDSKLLGASIDVTDLIEMYNKGHSAFTRSEKNNHVYVNLNIWINDEQDQYGNHAGVQLNSYVNKDKKIDNTEKDNALNGGKKKYVGNGRWVVRKENEPVAANQRTDFSGFPLGGSPQQQQGGAAGGFGNNQGGNAFGNTGGFPQGGFNNDLPF